MPLPPAWADLDAYNVVWTTPGHTAADSMPIGNGEVGLNLWVESNGDLVFYVSRTDAWSEMCRLLKLGQVRVSFSPNPFKPGTPFRQELKLREGRIEVTGGGGLKLNVVVDAHAPVVSVSGTSTVPVKVTAKVVDWRTDKHTLAGDELMSSWTMHTAPAGQPTWESPDVFANARSAVVWYHRNAYSVVPLTLKHQGLESLASVAVDPLLNRTFGGRMWGSGLVRKSPDTVASSVARKRFDVQIATDSSQPVSAEAWLNRIAEVARKAPTPTVSRLRTAAWWTAFWERSWVFVDGDSVAAVPKNDLPLRLGADSSGGSRFDGLIKRATVFDAAVDSEALHSHWSHVRGAPPSSVKRSSEFWGTEGGSTHVSFDWPKRTQAHDMWLDDWPADGYDLALGPVVLDPHVDLTRGFSVIARVMPRTLGGRILDNITPGGSDGFLFDTHDGELRLIVGHRTFRGPKLKTGVWQTLAATCDGKTGAVDMYVDGERVGGTGPEGNTPPSKVTQAYVLQRWMTACADRGNYPIKFNGSIFTVDAQYTGGPHYNPDWRRWGDCFWWQNTRFPYAAMPARGDYDGMASLFRMFEASLPLCRARAKLYHGVDGAYFPETMTIFGTYSNGDYGWDRTGHEAKDVLCPWWQYAWQQGLELTSLMLDYHDHTEDAAFLKSELLPMARAVCGWYAHRFPRVGGVLKITPTQAVETYWQGVINDTPSVAGLRAVLPRLLRLPGLSVSDRSAFTELLKATPKIPVGDKGVKPAEEFNANRSNVENPELYALWPFRVYGVGGPGEQVAKTTFLNRVEKANAGWQYDGQCAAVAGLAEEATASLLSKVQNSHPNHRFPAMWGPNYDWLPDQDHGSNIMLTLQNMLLQTDGDRVFVLPAWPKGWNARFKLHAPKKTVVECEVRDGKVERLVVTPKSRAKDVVVLAKR